MAKMTEEEYRIRHREYSKAYYRKKKKEKIALGLIDGKTQEKRKITYVKKPTYITLNKLKNGTVLIEAMTRKFKTTPYDRYTDYRSPKSNYHRKKRLEKMLQSINMEEKIVVLDDYSVQVYLKTENNLQEICDAVKDFVEESVKIMLEDLE